MQVKDDSAGEDLLKSNVADYEKHIIISALKRTGGNQSAAAKQLGTTKRILMYRIHKYNIDLDAFRRRRRMDRKNQSNHNEPGGGFV